MKEIIQLCDVIRETGFAIHRYGELWRCEIPDKEIHPHRHEHGLLVYSREKAQKAQDGKEAT